MVTWRRFALCVCFLVLCLFYLLFTAQCYAKELSATSVCSVCPFDSHSCSISNHHLVFRLLYFFMASIMANFGWTTLY